MSQTEEDGERKLIGDWKRTLNSAECNYSMSEKECLALVLRKKPSDRTLQVLFSKTLRTMRLCDDYGHLCREMKRESRLVIPSRLTNRPLKIPHRTLIGGYPGGSLPPESFRKCTSFSGFVTFSQQCTTHRPMVRLSE